MEFVSGIVDDEKMETLSKRLKKLEEDRLAKNEKLRGERDSRAANREQEDGFKAEFQRMKLDVVSQLQRCPELSSDKAALVQHLDEITRALQALHKLAADSQLFLSAYDKRMTNAILSCLQESLNEAQDKFLPKKKFTFKTRKKETEKKAAVVLRVDKDETDNVRAVSPFTGGCGFANVSGEELSMSADEVRRQDVELHDLKGCTVRIYGSPSTVHIRGLSDCTVLIGPVLTSIFVDECIGVIFKLACQQLRIHSTSKCIFYTHITSRSIIEDSKELRFAPYDWRYEDIDLHFELAAMDTNVNNWKAIDDFNWLALETPSPNWSIIEDNERITLEN